MRGASLRAQLLILFALFASACSALPQVNDGLSQGSSGLEPETVTSAGASKTSLAPLGQVAIGQVATLGSNNPLGVTRARVIDEYSAASGRQCRRVTVAERNPRLRLVCREPGGDWALVRGLVAANR